MKRFLAIVLAAFVGSAVASAQPRVGPDLAITGITASETRIGVGEAFTYIVTARNAGNAPCNWVNLTLQVPGEVDFINASSSAPLTCEPVPRIRIIACRSTWPAAAGRDSSCGPATR